APLGSPFAVVESPAQHEVDERRILARPRVDLPQLREESVEPEPAALEQLQRLLARQRVGEEQPQQVLVAKLDDRGVAEGPALAPVAPRVCEPVDAARTRAVRGVLARDEPFLLEPAQLGIDLAVARRPEEARRAVDGRLDLVARARAEREEAEDDRRDR